MSWEIELKIPRIESYVFNLDDAVFYNDYNKAVNETINKLIKTLPNEYWINIINEIIWKRRNHLENLLYDCTANPFLEYRLRCKSRRKKIRNILAYLDRVKTEGWE